MLGLLVRDIADGAQSLGELDLAAMCRRRGLPAPARQAVRRTPAGRIYLDAAWDDPPVSVEVDGAQHREGLQVSWDNLRQNEVVIEGGLVLRIDLIGLRIVGERFMDQLTRALGRG